ncbi:MAG: hypothetical protein GX299_00155 [Epulopiscium sp.]|nr:hypothetical protein [Candidatus Epulonipiscium sp.]
MNLIKKLAAFAVSGCLVISLAGCTAKTPEAEVKQALEKVSQATSMTSVIDVEMEVSVNDNTSAEKAQVSTNITYEPFSVKLVNKSRVGTPSETVTETYAEGSGDMVAAYMQYDNQWMKQTLKQDAFMDSFQMYDTKENIQAALENVPKWEEVSRENKVVTLKGVLPAEKVFSVLEATRALQVVGMTGLTKEYYKGVPDVEITLQIDEATHMPKAYSAELGSVLQVLMDNVMASFSEDAENAQTDKLVVSKYSIQVECSNIGKTQKVTIPQDALKTAVDVEQQMQAYSDDQALKNQGQEAQVSEDALDTATE